MRGAEGHHLVGWEGHNVRSRDGRMEGTGVLVELQHGPFGNCWGVVLPHPGQGVEVEAMTIRAELLTRIEE